MLLMNRRLGSLSISLAALLIGCATSASDGIPHASGNSGGGDTTGSGGGANGSSVGTGGGGFDFQPQAGADGSCAAEDVEAELTPVYMVFIYDTSGSMGDSRAADGTVLWENRAQRWEPMKAGMLAFFDDPGSSNLYASLEYFPATGDFNATCTANYASPSVPLTPLNESAPLINSLNAKNPGGGTPTLPALRGAVEYARELKRTNRNAHVTVVLVTDGEPAVVGADGQVDEACPAGDSLPNTVEGVAAIARAAYEDPSLQITVNVVGVGDAVDSLSQIAIAGGTQLVLITATDPEATSNTLKETLRSIQVAHFSCDMAIPDPPAGEVFLKDMVNVNFAHADGTSEPILKSVGCASGVGWQYDDEENPTMIQLCQGSCNAIQNDPTGKLKVAFGCATVVR